MMADLSESDFLQYSVQNAPHMMWFLGAGTSRTAGLPTATDIIWDLKHRYYCLHENQNLQSHDINNKAIKQKVQTYMESQGFPELWCSEEYSFYFDLIFGNDHGAQQKYIHEKLANDKVSLNIGHRILAALLELKQARIVFTTNFDEVIETAYAAVSGKNLSAFHLEGSYAALEALNAENFPIYAKIHGDFRYQKIKNLTDDLKSNDRDIQKCFLAASSRYGLIVSGYSGRDENVMSMFRESISQNNALPHGLLWTVPSLSDTAESVRELITYAREKGVHAHLVETGTFDEMLSKMWRQIERKPQALEAKVKTVSVGSVSIPLPAPGKKYPVLRTNALPVITLPGRCGTVNLSSSLTFADLKDMIRNESPKAILTYTDKVLFWGQEEEIGKIFPVGEINSIQPYDFDDTDQGIISSTLLKSFFEEAVATALCRNKPLFLRLKNRTHYAVVPNHLSKDDMFMELRKQLGFKGSPVDIAGNVPGLRDVTWAEAVSIRLEERDGRFWVMLNPDIWIKPLKRRQEAIDFMRHKRSKRYNNKSYGVLDAWIRILLGSVGSGGTVTVSGFSDTEFSAAFEIGTRTAYSFGR